MSIMPNFKGRVALVTGASRGIGRAIAIGLAEAGADVAVNYRERADGAAEVVRTIRDMGRRVLAVRADVSIASEVTAMMSRIARDLGAVDILINNAGIALRRSIEKLTEADFDQTMNVNLKSAFLCTQAVLPHMRAQKWGRIVNVSSGAARASGVIGAHYNASKAGLEGLTRGFATRLVAEGVTVNAVAPSLIATDMMPEARLEPGAHVPMQRYGYPEEVAQSVVLIAANAYMTGQTVQMNGGMHFI